MRLGHTILALVAAIGGLAACSALVSFSDLSGGQSDGGTDSAISGADGTVISSSGDAGAAFCRTVDANFCDDFERVTVAGAWSGVTATAGSSVTLAPDPSGGTVLVASVPAYVGANRAAFLLYDTADTFTEGEVSLDVIVPTSFAAGTFHPFVIDLIEMPTGVTEREVNVVVKPTATTLSAHTNYADGGITTVSTNFGLSVPLGKRSRLRVHVKLTAPMTITAFLDGAAVANLTPPVDFSPAKVELRVGLEGPSSTTPAVVETADNVVLSY